MGWYQALYEGGPQKGDASCPRPTGLRLLAYILRWHCWTLVKVNILFILFCLPVVTIPAAIKAMTRICVLLLRGKPLDLWSDWWGAFRRDFLRTTGAGTLAALALGAAGFGVSFYGRAMAENGLIAAPMLLLLTAMVIVVMALFSLFPLLEFAELSMVEAIRSALLLVLVRLPQNLAVLLVLAAMAVGYVLAYPYSSFVLGAIALSLFWLVACFASWPGLEKYVFHTRQRSDQTPDDAPPA